MNVYWFCLRQRLKAGHFAWTFSMGQSLRDQGRSAIYKTPLGGKYRDDKISLYAVGWSLLQLFLNCSAWLCLVGPFHYTLVMPVYHFLLLISNVPQLRKRGTLGRLFFNVPHFLRKTWDIGSTVFQCPPLFAPMSHVLWNYPGKCPVLLLRVKPAKPGYND